MSLPGLGTSVAAGPSIEPEAPTIHNVPAGSEWRFEVASSESLQLKLLSGDAEIFGTELAPQQPYNFKNTKAAVYTWHGCVIEVIGTCQVDYVAEETPIATYANLHFALENQREAAQTGSGQGPRVLVVGPDNAGKTSLVKFLTAYAQRSGWQPLTANLDPREGMLTIPGALSATSFTSIIDVEEGWGTSPTNGPTPVPVKLPLVYYLGFADPEENPAHFKPVAGRLALSCRSRLNEDKDARRAGIIIDTPGTISQGKRGYDILQHIIAEFAVNVVVVLGSERLYSDMNKRFNGQKAGSSIIEVVKLDRSGGAVVPDDDYVRYTRRAQIKEYFFGSVKNTLSPHTQHIDFSMATIYILIEQSDLLRSLLPGDDDSTSANSIFEKVEASSQLLHSVLAITQAKASASQDDIRDASILGFVYVAEVDENKRKLKLLTPLSGRLPDNAMLWGNWPESADLLG